MNDTHTVVAFRGIQSAVQLARILTVKKTDFSAGNATFLVHDGVARAYGAIRQWVSQGPGAALAHAESEFNRAAAANDQRDERQRQQPKPERRHVILVGHSLGGAMAQLAALDMVFAHGISPSQIQVFVFNAPRFFSAESAPEFPLIRRNIHLFTCSDWVPFILHNNDKKNAAIGGGYEDVGDVYISFVREKQILVHRVVKKDNMQRDNNVSSEVKQVTCGTEESSYWAHKKFLGTESFFRSCNTPAVGLTKKIKDGVASTIATILKSVKFFLGDSANNVYC